MKPLSKEELSKSAWEDFLNCQEVDDDAVNAYLCGYKRGYAKCIKQMQDEFNELLAACEVALQNQTNVETNKIFNQMKGNAGQTD